MKSLFDPVYNKEIIDRIRKLNSSAKPIWGKMSVAQMITHDQAPLKVAFEELQLKRGLIGLLFGGIAKKKLLGSEPFGKNLPTDKNFKITGKPDFEKERNKLIDYIKKLVRVGPNGIAKEPHPFFGKLTSEE